MAPPQSSRGRSRPAHVHQEQRGERGAPLWPLLFRILKLRRGARKTGARAVSAWSPGLGGGQVLGPFCSKGQRKRKGKGPALKGERQLCRLSSLPQTCPPGPSPWAPPPRALSGQAGSLACRLLLKAAGRSLGLPASGQLQPSPGRGSPASWQRRGQRRHPPERSQGGFQGPAEGASGAPTTQGPPPSPPAARSHFPVCNYEPADGKCNYIWG